MIIQKLTDKLQVIAHSGHSQNIIYVKIMDSYYKVGDVQREVVGDKTVYAIKAEPMGGSNGEKESNNEN